MHTLLLTGIVSLVALWLPLALGDVRARLPLNTDGLPMFTISKGQIAVGGLPMPSGNPSSFSYTMTFWLLPTEPKNNNNYRNIVQYGNSFDVRSPTISFRPNSTRLDFRVSTQNDKSWGDDNQELAAPELATGVWTHVALIVTGTSMVAFVNGSMIVNATMPSARLLAFNQDLWFSNNYDSSAEDCEIAQFHYFADNIGACGVLRDLNGVYTEDIFKLGYSGNSFFSLPMANTTTRPGGVLGSFFPGVNLNSGVINPQDQVWASNPTWLAVQHPHFNLDNRINVPGTAPGSNTLAAYYSGQLFAPYSSTYTFYLNCDDGAQLFINGNRVIDNDGLHAARTRSNSISLSKGYHDVEVYYYNNGINAVLELSWSRNGNGNMIHRIPPLFFSRQLTGENGWMGTFNKLPASFDPKTLQYPQHETLCTQRFQNIVPVLNLAGDAFTLAPWDSPNFVATNLDLTQRSSAVFSALLNASTSVSVEFQVASDDGARLSIFDQTNTEAILTDNPGAHPISSVKGAVNLTAGSYFLKVVYFDIDGPRAVQLQSRLSGGNSSFSFSLPSGLTLTSAEQNLSAATGTATLACNSGFFINGTVIKSCSLMRNCTAGFFVSVPSSLTSNRVCAPCALGQFSMGNNSNSCVNFQNCLPGTFIRVNGSSTSDRLCAPCTMGVNFSAFDNSRACVSVKPCASGMVEVAASTLSSDRVCAVVSSSPATTETSTKRSTVKSTLTSGSAAVSPELTGIATSAKSTVGLNSYPASPPPVTNIAPSSVDLTSSKVTSAPYLSSDILLTTSIPIAAQSTAPASSILVIALPTGVAVFLLLLLFCCLLHWMRKSRRTAVLTFVDQTVQASTGMTQNPIFAGFRASQETGTDVQQTSYEEISAYSTLNTHRLYQPARPSALGSSSIIAVSKPSEYSELSPAHDMYSPTQ